MFAKIALFTPLLLGIIVPAHGATFSGHTDGKDTVVIEAKGGDKDEQCNAAMSFKYRDLKSEPGKPKEDGRQFCPPKLIPAGTSIEMCQLKYVGITDIEVVPPAAGDCQPPGSPDPKQKKRVKNKP